LQGTVSVSVTPVSVAVLLMTSVPIEAAEPTVSTTVSVSLAPGARAPSVQVVPENPPTLAVMVSTLTPVGSVKDSSMTTPVAAPGPLLVAVTTYVRLPMPDPATTDWRFPAWLSPPAADSVEIRWCVDNSL
jgi:hypothetical protein